MEVYISDKEQLEIIRNWWRENGKFTIICIIAVLVLTYGWRYYQEKKINTAVGASVIYEQTLAYEANHQYSQVEFEVTRLLTNYANTPYASMAALISAQNAIYANKWSDAMEKFNWVIIHSKNKDLKQIAKIRQARLLLAMNRSDEALVLLNKIDADSYLPLINEIRGDIYASKGDKQAAAAAYQLALNTLKKENPNRSFLQMKYNQLNG